MIVRVLAASFAGALVFFLLGFVIYSFVVDPIMREHMNQFPGLMKEPMPNLGFLFAWNFMMSFLFAFIFDKWAGVRTFVGGIKAGFVLMLIIAVMSDLSYLAFMNVYKDLLAPVIDIAAATLLGTIACGVIGLVLGFLDKNKAASAS
jgi:hypothetical protein